jgi:hypothetical protein
MIGNETDAKFIRDWFVANGEGDPDYSEAPEGWKRLGRGVSRIAFLSPEGVAYKVDRYPDDGYSQTNEREAANLRKFYLRKMPKGCRLPRFSYYPLDRNGVMAMEAFTTLLRDRYKQGDDRDLRLTATRLGKALNSWDMHDQNIAVEEGTDTLVPIDLGI